MSPAKRHKPYSTQQFVDVLSEHDVILSRSTVIRMFDDGKLAGYRTPAGYRRIFARELRRYLRETLDTL